MDRSARATATGALALALTAPVAAGPSSPFGSLPPFGGAGESVPAWVPPEPTPAAARPVPAVASPSPSPASGPASPVPGSAPAAPVAVPAAVEPRGVAASAAGLGTEVVVRALSLLGVNYRFGGNSPETGLDCSGLVRHVFRDALGLVLPRRSEEISRVGGSVPAGELQPGDLVFFNTLRRAFSHVGIYIGDGRFVHAPSTGGAIRVEKLDRDYWVRRFDGARRLAAPAPGALAAAPDATAPSATRPETVPVALAAADDAASTPQARPDAVTDVADRAPAARAPVRPVRRSVAEADARTARAAPRARPAGAAARPAPSRARGSVAPARAAGAQARALPAPTRRG